jgi:hypothetical protein
MQRTEALCVRVIFHINLCGCDLSFDMPWEIARHAVVEDVLSELQRLGSPSIVE